MGVNARSKGQRAERAAIALLQPVINKVYAERQIEESHVPCLERNLMQSMKGGFDIVGLEWLALEIKHQETLQVKQWWEQTKRQAGASATPVLMYKQNNIKWRVMMWGYVPIGERKMRCPVDISVDAFLVFFEHRLIHELESGCKAG